MSNESDTTVGLFFEAGRMIRRAMDRDKESLSPAQYDALRFIKDQRDPSMRQIAACLRITAPSATSLCAELAKGGYVHRQADAKDRRQVLLTATKKGADALRETLTRRKKILRSVLSPLSSADHKDLQRIFSKVIENH